MRFAKHLPLCLSILAAMSAPLAADPGTAFNYQGTLQDNGIPVDGTVSLRFALYDAATLGSQVGSTIEFLDTTADNGRVSQSLDFGAGALSGAPRWLEVSADLDGGSDNFVTLAGRIQLLPVPYAVFAEDAADAALLDGIDSTGFATSGHTHSSLSASGSTASLSSTGRFVVGATDPLLDNTVSADSAAVIAGTNNTASGGQSGVVAGANNTTSASRATIVGGFNNTASNFDAAVVGGQGNSASGEMAVTLGGQSNTATGNFSVAAGRRAKALNEGTFVFADSTDANFTSTTNNTFLIRATNGVGINIATPTEALHVAGDARVTGAIMDSSNDAGTSGQVLTSTATGTNWMDASTLAVAPSSLSAIGSTATLSGTGRFVVGATDPGDSNSVDADYGAAIGGFANSVSSTNSVVLGGVGNNIGTGGRSAILGGFNNTVSSFDNVVVGGEGNDASGTQGAVALGGVNNTASGEAAVTLGGDLNTASGRRAVAAGRRAMAINDGSFVFADSTDADFSSTTDDTFLIRATNGVGINIETPAEALHVAGNALVTGAITAGDLTVDTTTLTVDTANNRVGVGTASPEHPLHVVSTLSQVAMIESSSTIGTWLRLENNTTGGDTWNLVSTGSGNGEGAGHLLVRDGSFVRAIVDGTTGFVGVARTSASHPIHVGTGGTNGNGAHLTVGGTWTNVSSRELKEGFEPVDAAEVLDKVAALDITRWTYKGSDEGEHIGPVAEDFHAAFGTGRDAKAISTVDADGVALAAIQALKKENDALRDKNAELEARLARIEEALATR